MSLAFTNPMGVALMHPPVAIGGGREEVGD